MVFSTINHGPDSCFAIALGRQLAWLLVTCTRFIFQLSGNFLSMGILEQGFFWGENFPWPHFHVEAAHHLGLGVLNKTPTISIITWRQYNETFYYITSWVARAFTTAQPPCPPPTLPCRSTPTIGTIMKFLSLDCAIGTCTHCTSRFLWWFHKQNKNKPQNNDFCTWILVRFEVRLSSNFTIRHSFFQ